MVDESRAVLIEKRVSTTPLTRILVEEGGH
jgi:hypothetical protein